MLIRTVAHEFSPELPSYLSLVPLLLPMAQLLQQKFRAPESAGPCVKQIRKFTLFRSAVQPPTTLPVHLGRREHFRSPAWGASARAGRSRLHSNAAHPIAVWRTLLSAAFDVDFELA